MSKKWIASGIICINMNFLRHILPETLRIAGYNVVEICSVLTVVFFILTIILFVPGLINHKIEMKRLNRENEEKKAAYFQGLKIEEDYDDYEQGGKDD